MQALKFWFAAPNAIEISRTMANLPMTPISQKQPHSARPLVRYGYTHILFLFYRFSHD